MKISIMQPYFAPYFGYFKMINAVDKFIFYDDVNYIKNGWINKNKIKVNGNDFTFTVPIKNQSSFKKINETHIDWNNRNIEKMIKTFKQEYSKKNVLLLDGIINLIESKPITISELAINSILFFCDYLSIKTKFKKSSDIELIRKDNKVENIVKICKIENCEDYINPIGGINLYDKKEFKDFDINLSFIKTNPSMSIIDVCMNNDIKILKEELEKIELI